MLRIAVDCMGGDYAPLEIVRGCILAAKELGYKIYLVGDKEQIIPILEKAKEHNNSLLEVVHAPDKVEMHEPPSNVLKKKNSSLYVAGMLVRKGEADGLVSAGNTGAVLAVGKFIVGAEEEVERPSIGVALPNPKGKTVLIDVGANVDCKPKHLVQFAVIGHTYAEEILGIKNPRVGILSIGEEEGKGNELVKETYPLLKATKLNFKGNAEGRDIYAGTFDVIVCDGFVGNVILKASESLGLAVVQMIKEEIKRSILAKLGALLLMPALNRFKKKADFAEYGGIPLLGAKKPVIITHGRANAKAIKNAVRVAGEFLNTDFNKKLVYNLKTLIPEGVKV
ncbi:phosphate acyltransferase PlsX [Aquifex aeolicus]|uniref:Phosphate acyltransferase n=1 Tax=Aquifex aeolicus (strain VF5) TaxID=224324 RepID=PLSX_AQUAE|nr:phosphate acyltransferase PlsX [Aquifex aeolicus]O67186.1 RecName: Full=Phosphate acyltransferase; AltName: Full=Acyl-ACP phosphotransacylase; AltName: Full=Acyl-[acyl-carrier-protein]--phosphate acyltransferase; AltName: Full=Phosphate-acyl-ACP acyltransferase [Aquifex aeolicus VF5]AAC07145.1 PlsX protein [Aquifex aeolicus VF5]